MENPASAPATATTTTTKSKVRVTTTETFTVTRKVRSKRANLSIMVLTIMSGICIFISAVLQLVAIFKTATPIDYFATILTSIVMCIIIVFILLMGFRMKCWNRYMQLNFGFVFSPIALGIFLFVLSCFFNISFTKDKGSYVLAYSSLAVISMIFAVLLAISGCVCW